MEHVRVDVMAATPRKGASKKITPSTLKPAGKAEKAGKPEVYEEIIAKYIDGRKEHEWYTKGFDPKKVEEMKAYYKERYQQDVK